MASKPCMFRWPNRDGSCSTGVLIAMGGTLSTAGKGAQGDFTGVGAAGLDTNVGFSDGFGVVLVIVLTCAAEPSLSTVAFGPTVVSFCIGDLEVDPSGFSSFSGSAGASVALGGGSFCDRLIFVPSFHSIVSGAQSSSSSSISAHFASLLSPSSCGREAS